jgi:aquaporin Z
LVAELAGTAMLVFFGVASAVLTVPGYDTKPVWVALTFMLVLTLLAYTLGPISGGHFNPAVTLGMFLARRVTAREAVSYVVAQLIGGIIAGGLLKFITEVGDVTDQTKNVGSTIWHGVNTGGAFMIEALLTFLLVFVVLMMTGRSAAAGFAGLVIGFTLGVCHLIGIPTTGSSVNPARSLGSATWGGSNAMQHLWLYLVAPLVGAVLAALLWRVVRDPQDAGGDATAGEAALAGDSHRSSLRRTNRR